LKEKSPIFFLSDFRLCEPLEAVFYFYWILFSYIPHNGFRGDGCWWFVEKPAWVAAVALKIMFICLTIHCHAQKLHSQYDGTMTRISIYGLWNENPSVFLFNILL